MTIRLFLRVVVAVILVTAMAAPSQAGKYLKSSTQSKASTLQQRICAYTFPAESRNTQPVVIPDSRIPLVGASSSIGISPGIQVGSTWYDNQQIGSMGRMIETGSTGDTGATMVHFGWTYLVDENLSTSRSYAYNAFNSQNDSLLGVTLIHPTGDKNGGYVNVDVTPDNRGIVGGHCYPQKGREIFQPQFHFDAASFEGDFADFARLPDSLAGYVQTGGDETMWPKLFTQIGSNDDTVIHVFACNRSVDGTEATWWLSLMYFRYFIVEDGGYWDQTPYVVDTCDPVAQDITGERFGDQVCLMWFSWLAYEDYEGCDTCSGPPRDGYDGLFVGSMDNDLYVQISQDQGETFAPRQNITHCPIDGLGGYKAGREGSVLFDQDGNLHVVWVAPLWPADPEFDCNFDEPFGWECRLMHWTNTPGYEEYIRTICDHSYPILAEWEVSCSPPLWSQHVSKPSISECDGKLYCLYTQFNNIPDSVWDDCASWVSWPDAAGANGELWVQASTDGGFTWGSPMNLTNSYTPGCDPGECASDYWASMSRWGRQVQAGEQWDGSVVIDPIPGGSATDYYLDIQYVEDLDPSSPLQTPEFTSWQNVPIKWFRIPCFEPICDGNLSITPWAIEDWTGTEPGIQKDTTIVLANYGCSDVNYNMTIEEDNGPVGWLNVSGLSGEVPFGLNNTEIGTVHLNNGGIIVVPDIYFGRLIFEGSFVTSPDTVEISLYVGPEPPPIAWDTVHTSCLALVVGNNGSMGHDGVGKVNMDYINAGDCDPTADVYLYDGSPVVFWLDGDDTLYSTAIWGTPSGAPDDPGFRPTDIVNTVFCSSIDAEFHHTGTFLTADSSLGLHKMTVAPQGDCPFIIEYLKVWSYDGELHDGIVLGEIIDWDVPWDFLEDDPLHHIAYVNYGYVDAAYQMTYQQGYNSPLDTNCQSNEARFGGNAFVEAYDNGTLQEYTMSGSVVDNELTQQTNGIYPQGLYDVMNRSGWTGTDSVSDLHSIITYHNNLSLESTDLYEVVTVLATVHEGDLADLKAAVDAGKAWYAANGGINIFADDDGDGYSDLCHGCCTLRGDYNMDGEIGGTDILCVVNYLWGTGIIGPECPGLACLELADVNGDGDINGMDVVYLVNYLWNDGPPPPPCP